MNLKEFILSIFLSTAFFSTYSMTTNSSGSPQGSWKGGLESSVTGLEWFCNDSQADDCAKQPETIIYLENHIVCTDVPKPTQFGFSDDEQMFTYFYRGISTLKIIDSFTYALLSSIENCPADFSIEFLKTVHFSTLPNFSFPKAHKLLILCTQNPLKRVFSANGTILAVYYPAEKGSTIGNLGLCNKVTDPGKKQLVLLLNKSIHDPENQDNTKQVNSLFEQHVDLLRIWAKLTPTEKICLGSCYNFDIQTIKTGSYWWACTAL